MTKENRNDAMSIENAVNSALDEMPKDFSIREFLLQNRERVVAMIVDQYNEEKAYAIAREAREKAKDSANNIADGND